MNNNPEFILERGAVLIDNLNPLRLIGSINALKTIRERKRRTVAVIGLSNLKDTANILNIAFGYHFLDADRMACVGRPCRIHFTHTGNIETLPEETLRDLYAALESSLDETVDIRVELPCSAVDDIDALLLFSPYGGTGIDWERENSLFDYALFVTNAIAALSITERFFLSTIGGNLIGGQRLALALANSVFVSADDYKCLLESSNGFMERTFKGKMPILSDTDDELKAYFDKCIAAEIQQHYSSAIEQIVDRNSRIILETIADAKEHFSVDQLSITNDINELEKRRGEFAQKAEALCGMAGAFIDGSVKSPLLREINEYSEGLTRTALKGARNLMSAEEAAQSIEAYFSAAWEYFLSEQMPVVRDMFEEEAKHIERQLRSDTKALFSGLDCSVFQAESTKIAKMSAAEAVLRGQDYLSMNPERKAINASTLMLTAMVPLAFLNFPMAIAAAAASFGMRKYEKIKAKEQLGNSIKRMVDGVAECSCRAVQQAIDDEFAIGKKDLNETIKGAYARMIDSTLDSLKQLRDSLDDLRDKMRFVTEFEAETADKLFVRQKNNYHEEDEA